MSQSAGLGWTQTTLEEVCDFRGGGTPSKAVHRFWKGDIPWVSPKDMKSEVVIDSEDHITAEAIENSTTSLIPKGSLLIVVRSGILARVVPIAITGREVAVNQDIKALVPRRGVEPRFVYHLLHAQMGTLRNLVGRGATVHRLLADQLRELPVALPPLPVQQRIVAILDEAFAAIATAKASAEKNLQYVQETFESVLQCLCDRREATWVSTTLGKVCDLFQGLAINVKSKHLLVNRSSLPLLRIKDLRDGTEEQYVAESGYPPNAKVVEDDIIYTRTGQVGLVFRGRIGVLHNNSFKIVPRSGLSRDYLYWWLQNPRFKRKILKLAGRAAQADIAHSSFKEQEICVPDPEFQRRSSVLLQELFDLTRSLDSIYRRKLTALNNLSDSLLHSAFTGRLADAHTSLGRISP